MDMSISRRIIGVERDSQVTIVQRVIPGTETKNAEDF